MLMYLIGEELQRQGEIVYVVEHAGALSNLNKQNIMRLEDKLQDGKKLYLLVDEVHQNTKDPMWNYLLKQTRKTIIIGFGIPQIEETSPAFERKYEPSFVLLTKEDFSKEEDLQLLGRCANVSNTKMISDLVDWMLVYTGGHTYPFLKLCEYMLRHQEQSCKEKTYELIVTSAAFYESSIFKSITDRAYDLSERTRESAYRILETGAVSSFDKYRINKIGLWNGTTSWFLSNFLVSYLFKTVEKKAPTEDEIDLFSGKIDLEKVLLYGLSEMKEDDFYETFNGNQRNENAIGSIFAMKLCRWPILLISPQTQVIIDKSEIRRGCKPTVDFFFNGRLNTYLELTRNRLELEKHFDKFEIPGGNYYIHRDNYAILDFDLSSKPPNEKMPAKYKGKGLEKIMYSFVLRENALYVGNKMAHSNVSKFLKSSSPRDMGKRMFTTFSKLIRYM